MGYDPDAVTPKVPLREVEDEPLTTDEHGHVMSEGAPDDGQDLEIEDLPASLLDDLQIQQAELQLAKHRRRFARVPFHLKVTVYTEETFIAGIVWNLSEGGTFIITGQPFDVDTRVDFECDLPDGTVRLGGRVAWRRYGAFAEGQPPPGMGVQFGELSPHVVMALRAFTLRRMEDLGVGP